MSKIEHGVTLVSMYHRWCTRWSSSGVTALPPLCHEPSRLKSVSSLRVTAANAERIHSGVTATTSGKSNWASPVLWLQYSIHRTRQGSVIVSSRNSDMTFAVNPSGRTTLTIMNNNTITMIGITVNPFGGNTLYVMCHGISVRPKFGMRFRQPSKGSMCADYRSRRYTHAKFFCWLAWSLV